MLLTYTSTMPCFTMNATIVPDYLKIRLSGPHRSYAVTRLDYSEILGQLSRTIQPSLIKISNLSITGH